MLVFNLSLYPVLKQELLTLQSPLQSPIKYQSICTSQYNKPLNGITTVAYHCADFQGFFFFFKSNKKKSKLNRQKTMQLGERAKDKEAKK